MFIRRGNIWAQTSETAPTEYPLLPADFYVLKVSIAGPFLEEAKSFVIPAKLYGDTENIADRILSTFKDRQASTGVLLVGKPGSGKTLLAKVIGYKASVLDMPVIMVNSTIDGTVLGQFLSEMKQPAVVIFDEFEKIYDKREQQTLLSVLDGVYGVRKLFVLTANNPYGIEDNMKNRPGRIYYSLSFDNLDKKSITEYLDANLLDKSRIAATTQIVIALGGFNFDMLKALVEEMNRYDEPCTTALKYLNVRENGDGESRYLAEVKIGDTTHTKSVRINPLDPDAHFGIRIQDDDNVYFSDPELVSYDIDTGIVIAKAVDDDLGELIWKFTPEKEVLRGSWHQLPKTFG